MGSYQIEGCEERFAVLQEPRPCAVPELTGLPEPDIGGGGDLAELRAVVADAFEHGEHFARVLLAVFAVREVGPEGVGEDEVHRGDPLGHALALLRDGIGAVGAFEKAAFAHGAMRTEVVEGGMARHAADERGEASLRHVAADLGVADEALGGEHHDVVRVLGGKSARDDDALHDAAHSGAEARVERIPRLVLVAVPAGEIATGRRRLRGQVAGPVRIVGLFVRHGEVRRGPPSG